MISLASNLNCRHFVKIALVELDSGLLHARTNLRLDMQFELITMGNERFGAEYHSLIRV